MDAACSRLLKGPFLTWLSLDNLRAPLHTGDELMGRTKHPKKEIEEALKHAESRGWVIKEGGAHAWGKIYCPFNDNECRCGEFCITSVWSTPRNPTNHASQLCRVVDNCARQREKLKADKEQALKVQ
jgi:hypothetical protein